MDDSTLATGNDGNYDDGMNEISQLLNDYTSLQAAHRSLVKRCESQTTDIWAEVQEEMESLKATIKNLEAKLVIATSEKEELNATVRDLRVRVEESRRAIMRLQGTSGTGTGAAGSQNTTSTGSNGGVAGNPNRRSMLPGSLTSWNPREIASPSSSSSMDQLNPSHSAEEAAELKKSKRASLAFGPNANAQGTIGRRTQGHRRVASGSRIGQNDEETISNNTSMAPPTNTPGLRELHLGASPNSFASGYSSKRSSFLGGFPNILSPSSVTVDLPPEDSTEKGVSGSLLMPAKVVRRTSNSSSLSGGGGGGTREETDSQLLGIPRNESRSNLSSSASNKTSPILETEENNSGGPLFTAFSSDGTELPWTAKPGLTAVPHSTLSSTFGFMQQQQQIIDNNHLQRLVAEQKIRVQDRDARLEEMFREMQTLKIELEEAKEARTASEACLKALRDFVKDEGGQSTDTDGGAQILKGVKLPPLPTDQDTDDLSSDTPYQSNATNQGTTSSTPWRSFSNTFAGLSRSKSYTSDEMASKSAMSEDNNKPLPPITDPSAAPQSPVVGIGTSFGNLWSRSSASGRRKESISVSSNGPSDSTMPTTSDSRHTSMTSVAGETTAIAAASSAPPSAYKGFGWFSKRATSEESIGDINTPSPSLSPRVSSPPFASLDNHVLTLNQVNNGGDKLRKASVTSNSGSTSRDEIEPNDRIRKTMEKSGMVDEDTGFVPSTFDHPTTEQDV